MTRAAIHQIETGRARPSHATLQLIAKGTGKPITYFLDEAELAAGLRPSDNARLSEVEALFEKRCFEEGRLIAESLLASYPTEDDEARLRLWIAASLLMQREHVSAALEHVRIARRTFERAGDLWLLVECMDWEAYALHLEHNPWALEVAEEALKGCRNLDPVPGPTEARILSHIGYIHIDHERWQEAASVLEAALAALESLADLPTMAQVGSNLAIVLWELGDQARAFDRANLALSIAQALGDWNRMVAGENNLAEMCLRRGDLDTAHAHLSRAMEHCNSMSLDREKSAVLRTLVRYYLLRGSLDAAERTAHEALEVSRSTNQPLYVARCHEYQAEIASRRQLFEDSDREYEKAIEILQGLGAEDRLRECQLAYAAALEERGDPWGANRQLRAVAGVLPLRRLAAQA